MPVGAHVQTIAALLIPVRLMEPSSAVYLPEQVLACSRLEDLQSAPVLGRCAVRYPSLKTMCLCLTKATSENSCSGLQSPIRY